MNRNNLISQIHIAKKDLALDDDTYRAALKSATGKTSCRDMSLSDLMKAVQAFKERGFKVTRKKGRSPASAGRRVDKMRAIWIEMGYAGFIADNSEQALLSWVKSQMTRTGATPPESLEWLENHDKINRLLEQLKKWDRRVRTAALNADLKTISDTLAHFDSAGQSFSQTDVTRVLLDGGCICWHTLFSDIGLPQQEHYTTNRNALRPVPELKEINTCA